MLNRNEIPAEYKWDFTHLFKTQEDWEAAYKECEDAIPALAALKGTLGQSAEALFDAFEKIDAFDEKFSRVAEYAFLQKVIDGGDTNAQNMTARVSMLGVKLGTALSFVSPEVMAIPEDTRTPLLAPTEPAPPRTMPMELGYLQVWVTTASTALPIEGAHVTVSYDSSGGERRTAQYVGATDESGRTETIPLPAVSAQASLSLDGDATPFTLYNIEVFADGFYRVENLGVPMYGGVRAVQPVRLIPLPEGTPSGEITYRDSAPQGLEERA